MNLIAAVMQSHAPFIVEFVDPGAGRNFRIHLIIAISSLQHLA
jgi:hypothetical protein